MSCLTRKRKCDIERNKDDKKMVIGAVCKDEKKTNIQRC